MKKLMIVAVAALLGLSWWTTFSSAVQKPAEYQSYLAEAQKNEKKGIYYDAILNYQKALEYHPENMDIYLKIAEAYKNLGDENGFIQACTQAMNLEGDGEQAVMILADYYLEKGQKACRSVMNTMRFLRFCHPVPRLLCRQENGDLSLQKEIRF